MKTHTVYFETTDDVSGQDLVLAIQGAFEYAVDDYQECKKEEDKYRTTDEPDTYQARIDLLESIFILEDEPDPHQGIDPWGSESDFPREDWKAEVANNDTHLGYTAWVLNQREQKELDDEQH